MHSSDAFGIEHLAQLHGRFCSSKGILPGKIEPDNGVWKWKRSREYKDQSDSQVVKLGYSKLEGETVKC